ncbi:hypothetical protein ASZ90_015664 [hydrocarbon metagenome]|uniref:Uncharacterized protein n=1 Tax=hydrocarbon metagenome TaxID=938273 RepID=A0A0W8F1A2_9ZZZZ
MVFDPSGEQERQTGERGNCQKATRDEGNAGGKPAPELPSAFSFCLPVSRRESFFYAGAGLFSRGARVLAFSPIPVEEVKEGGQLPR